MPHPIGKTRKVKKAAIKRTKPSHRKRTQKAPSSNKTVSKSMKAGGVRALANVLSAISKRKAAR